MLKKDVIYNKFTFFASLFPLTGILFIKNYYLEKKNMNYIPKYLALGLLSAGLLSPFSIYAQELSKEQLLTDLVLQSLQTQHFSPRDLDDKYSAQTYQLYLERLDNNKRFFLQSDIDKLADYKLKLDEQLKAGNLSFFEAVMAIYEQRFEQSKTFYKEILAQPFDFETVETIETDGKKLAYAKTETELKDRWRKTLKYQTLSRIQTRLEIQEEALAKKDTSLKVKTFAETEKDEREKALKNYDAWAADVAKDKREERLAFFFNSYLGVMEPHTQYFPPLEKENFDIRMAGKLEGIGASLREEEGFIKVARVVPGSAAWRQGDLKDNDKIIKVAQGTDAAVDVVDMKIDDVLPLIRGKKGTEVRLTVRKPDGTIKVIPIVRDVVVLEDSYAKSAILDFKKTKQKVGLIDLRTFYADFEDPRGRRCAKDVKAEVQKLIAEEVDGIIIDLRFNGGGSLSDVVDMTGFFIDKGPVVQVKSGGKEPSVLDDKDISVLYDGPLVILVNNFSASASEIMAAALQDYGRAVIIGTAPTTFGKGTVQRFFNLDEVVPREYKKYGELGAVKITIQQFYRINGGSTQLKGVAPDIVLPSQYSYLEIGEKDEDFPLPWTEINAARYKPVSKSVKINEVKAASAKRIANNKTYKLLEENARWVKTQDDASTHPLQLSAYRAERKAENDKAKIYKEALEKDITGLKVSALLADQPNIKGDSARKESAEAWHKQLMKDFYLEEALYVVKDLK